MAYKLSKEQVKEEIRKCGNDPIYFLKNYVKITHTTKGLIPFTTFDYQDDLLKDFSDHRFNVILKARQLGISTIVAGYATWLMLFRREKAVLVLATKFKTASNLVIKVKKMMKSVPEWLRIAQITVDNQTSFELSNGSSIKASTTSKNDAGRSEALSLLIVDEAAFVENMEELWTGVFPTISTGGRCIALSTPNGVGNWFYKTYTDAENGINNFHPVKLPWHVHPDYTPEWFAEQTKAMSRRLIAQEFECFDGNTKIFTDLGFKNIKELKIGDRVLTHKGRFRRINKVRSKKAKNIYKINSFFNRNYSYVTGEHPFYNEKHEWQCLENIDNDARLCSLPKKIEFNREIKQLDLLKEISPSFFKLKETSDNKIYQNDRRFKTLHNRFINLDYNFGKFIGLYMSEGYINNKQTNVTFCFNYKKEIDTWVKDLQKYIDEYFGLSTYKIYNKRGTSSGTMIFSSPIIVPLLKKFVDGDKAYNKKLSNYAYSMSNKEFLKGVLDGIFIGDGCIKYDYDKVINITSKDMIYDIKYILSLIGNGYTSFGQKSVSKNGTIQGREVSLHAQHILKLLRTVNKETERVSDLIPETTQIQDFKSLYKGKYKRKSSYNKVYNNTDAYFTCRLLTKEKIEQEIEVYNISVEEDESYVTEHFVVHNCSFNMSGETVVHSDNMEEIKQQICEPKHRTGFDRNYWIWEEPQNGASYIVVADVARGDGNDNSVFHVLKLETMEQVAEYQGKPALDMFASMLNSVGREYANALMVVENNNVGYNVLEKLIDMEYPNLYFSTKASHEYIEQSVAEVQNNVVPGFSTTSKTRPLIIAKMEEFIRNRIIKVKSGRLYQEFETFVWNNGRPEAMRGYHDDLIMSIAICCWVRDTALTANKRDAAYTKAILGSIMKANSKINTLVAGQQGYKQNEAFDPYKEDIRQKYKDLFWLYKG